MRRTPLRFALLLVITMLFAACRTPAPPLEVVPEVDLDRYAGRWYEISSFPQRFQRGCVATQANYAPLADGRIRVENECRDGSLDGDPRHVEGVARVRDSESRAKLEVQFFWPFWGDYWIIDLDPDYRFAAVGHPSRDYLWILSRTPSMEPAAYTSLLERVAAKGFEIERLVETLQPVDNAADTRFEETP